VLLDRMDRTEIVLGAFNRAVLGLVLLNLKVVQLPAECRRVVDSSRCPE
jgi:hypothetical protein